MRGEVLETQPPPDIITKEKVMYRRPKEVHPTARLRVYGTIAVWTRAKSIPDGVSPVPFEYCAVGPDGTTRAGELPAFFHWQAANAALKAAAL